MKICLSKEAVLKFRTAIKNGELDIDKLSNAESSAVRREIFERYVGKKAAADVNAEFEKKLLLKNQQAGMIDWIKTVGGLKKETERTLLNKVKKMDNALSAQDIRNFKEDLIKKKLGFGVDLDNVKQISKLSNDVSLAESRMLPDYTFPDEASRQAYGDAVADLTQYINDVRNGVDGLSSFKERSGKRFAELGELAKDKPALAAWRVFEKGTGLTKALKFSLDLSYALNQGIKYLYTDPKFWWKNTKNMVNAFRKSFGKDGDKIVMRETISRIMSEPNYINGRMRKAGLALNTIEEQFGETLAGQIPYLGAPFRASETAFTVAAYMGRVHKFNALLNLAEATGQNIDDPRLLKAIGKISNSLSGRGGLGKLESAAGIANIVFTSARFLKANVDLLTGHILDKDIPIWARKQALLNLGKFLGAAAGVLLTFKMVDPDSVELDPRSSDFGKIRVGNTRFSVTGGIGPFAVLLGRIMTGEKKSSTTGKVKKLGETYGANDLPSSLMGDFFYNKFSPFSRSFIYALNGVDDQGEPFGPGKATKELFAPLPVENAQELLDDPNSANIIAAMFADFFGMSSNTFSAKKK